MNIIEQYIAELEADRLNPELDIWDDEDQAHLDLWKGLYNDLNKFKGRELTEAYNKLARKKGFC